MAWYEFVLSGGKLYEQTRTSIWGGGLREAGMSIARTADLAGCSIAQVKRVTALPRAKLTTRLDDQASNQAGGVTTDVPS